MDSAHGAGDGGAKGHPLPFHGCSKAATPSGFNEADGDSCRVIGALVPVAAVVLELHGAIVRRVAVGAGSPVGGEQTGQRDVADACPALVFTPWLRSMVFQLDPTFVAAFEVLLVIGLVFHPDGGGGEFSRGRKEVARRNAGRGGAKPGFSCGGRVRGIHGSPLFEKIREKHAKRSFALLRFA